MSVVLSQIRFFCNDATSNDFISLYYSQKPFTCKWYTLGALHPLYQNTGHPRRGVWTESPEMEAGILSWRTLSRIGVITYVFSPNLFTYYFITNVTYKGRGWYCFNNSHTICFIREGNVLGLRSHNLVLDLNTEDWVVSSLWTWKKSSLWRRDQHKLTLNFNCRWWSLYKFLTQGKWPSFCTPFST